MSVKVTIHSSGLGTCALTGKEGDGIAVTFEDGTVKESFLSWRAFRQLLSLKAGQGGKPSPATAMPPASAAVVK